MSELYQVVFTGELRHHANPEQAARDFAVVFRVPEDKAWKLVLGGGEHILKRKVDAANAERYRLVLEEIGLLVRIEPAGTPIKRPGAAATQNPASDATAGAPAAPNPFAPPQAELMARVDDQHGPAMTGPHRRPASHGWRWIMQGFALFRQSGWAWVGATLLFGIINIGIALVPFIGPLFSTLLNPVLFGGFMYGAHMQRHGGRFQVADMFQGFRARFAPLVALGALYLVFSIAIMVIVGILLGLVATFGGGLTLANLDQQDPMVLLETLGPLLLVTVLLLFPLLILLAMAYWLAPALVMLDDLTPLAALNQSLQGCLRNLLALLLYGLSFLLLGFLVLLLYEMANRLLLMLLGTWAEIIVIGLGWLALMLVLIPISIAATYAAYRDIFFDSR